MRSPTSAEQNIPVLCVNLDTELGSPQIKTSPGRIIGLRRKGSTTLINNSTQKSKFSCTFNKQLEPCSPLKAVLKKPEHRGLISQKSYRLLDQKNSTIFTTPNK